MTTRNAQAHWEGDLKSGKGSMKLGSGAYEGPFSFKSRFESGAGTNPEELIGAAHAGCFSMAFSNMLSEAGHVPKRIATQAKVHLELLDEGPRITRIELDCEGDVPGIQADTFQDVAAKAKTGCPVSKALAGVEISLKAKLISA